DVVLFEVNHMIYRNLFENIWTDPRNTYFTIRLTYYKPKIITNTIDMSDIFFAKINEHININHNHVRFELDGDPSDFENDREYILEFEYESLEWKVLGIEDSGFFKRMCQSKKDEKQQNKKYNWRK
ncbi:MAG: hypothetical protein RSD04_05355, partial [Clostridia bacterium]